MEHAIHRSSLPKFGVIENKIRKISRTVEDERD